MSPVETAAAAAIRKSELSLLTLSFRGDFELCRLLCDSVEAFVPPDITHTVAVPRSDLRIFAGLANRRRGLVAQEDLLPSWLVKLPLPSPAWRKRLFLPRRNIYLSLKGKPVRGWIAQQIMKLAAARHFGGQVVIHLDSDAVFIRPLTRSDFIRGEACRLLRLPGAGHSPMHIIWHRAASKLLGLEPSDYHGADYIDNCVSWRKPVVERLLAHIENVTGLDWRLALCRTGDFSEYVLYGVYCDKVLGLSAAGHFGAEASLSQTMWTAGDADANADARKLADTIRPNHLTIGIQSTIAMPLDARRQIIAAAVAAAAQAGSDTTVP